MAYTKSQEEVALILEGGKILGGVLEKLTTMVKPGVATIDIDTEAERLIREAGGIPAFKGYGVPGAPPFPATICSSVNNEIVHGIPSENQILKEGDIYSMDIGMQYPANSGLGKNGNGFFTDTAVTVPVGEIEESTQQLLSVTQKSLYKAIEKCEVGAPVSIVGKTVEEYIDPQGYGIVRDLVGHGVGHAVHEEPAVPNFYDKRLNKLSLEERVVIAIEPMITVGSYETDIADDEWTIITKDRSLSAHFEHTIVITKDGPVVATQRPSETIS